MSALVTDAESHVGLEVIRSLGKNGISVTASASKKKAMGFHSRYTKNKFIYPNPEPEPEGFIKWALNQVRDNKYDVFLPIDEGVLVPVSKNKEKFLKYTNVPVADYEILKIANNKALTVKKAAEMGIGIPRTFFSPEIKDLNDIRDELEYPLVLKPYFGRGANGIKYAASFEELNSMYKKNIHDFGSNMIQEKIQGEKISFSGIIGDDGEVKRILVHKMIREYPVSGGPLIFGETIKNEEIKKLGIKMLEGINYTGIAHIEFFIDEKDGKPKILEINPRLYGSIAMAAAAGVDYPCELYRIAMGEDIGKNLDYKIGIRGRNILGDTKHLIKLLKGNNYSHYKYNKWQTLGNFLDFRRNDIDFIFSLKDPKPFFYQAMKVLKLV